MSPELDLEVQQRHHRLHLLKRVVKRAGDTFFGGVASPATKAAAGKGRAQLARADAAYTSIEDDYEAEKNSQEIFKYCLEQSTLD